MARFERFQIAIRLCYEPWHVDAGRVLDSAFLGADIPLSDIYGVLHLQRTRSQSAFDPNRG